MSQYNDQKMTTESLKDRLKRYEQSTKALFHNNPNVIWWMDGDGSILNVNSRIEEVFGYNKKNFVNQPFDRFLADRDLETAIHCFVAAKKGKPSNFDAAFFHKDGYPVELNVTFVPVTVDYKIVGVYSIAKDITEEKKYEAAVKESNDFVIKILESITDAFISIDSEWRITYWNKEAERLMGKKREEVIGVLIWDAWSQVTASVFFTRLQKAFNEQVTVHYETYHELHDRWYSIHVYPSNNGLSLYLQDISERKKAQDQIAHLTFYDTLTGLPNQRLFKQFLNHSLTLSKSESFAVLVIDMDRFKMVNDSFGHLQGDNIMVAISRRLISCIGEDDIVSRYEGDNFALLLRNVNRVYVKRIAERIIEDFQKPFVVENMEIVITPSIGISFSSGDGREGENLLTNAETAMRNAKDKGKNNYQLYTKAMNNASFLTLERELRRALTHNELMVYYQPQMDARTRKIVGAEALIRWENPERGIIFPDQFINLAEETGLIVPISEWVLNTACAQNKAWQDHGYSPITISVNLSPRQFAQSKLIERVKIVLEQTRLDPQYLHLEVTESMTMDVQHAIKTLRELKLLDVLISMDDFGKGYSSLSYLKQFPLDILKIDRSFVHNCTVDNHDATIVKTIISMAHNLNLKVIAEGVETEEQLDFLQKHLCNEVQGYLFSRPIAAQEFEEKFFI